jgi:hypothetical protein
MACSFTLIEVHGMLNAVVANGVGYRGMITLVFTSLCIVYAALLLLVANRFKHKDVGGCKE